ncbi:hypothetical protein AUEXF2481DRAFT_143878 [Aureobasidium subglaciale EXF-2481]|uniref:Uncharacterized protein n=1 Tax=Aureobasidium subglaciale (strain EXF-2481) TaxID=1043005 RepID=A0A074YSB5_AURSE|nr:uncharacterized protein AUEXF2481DRAFT_143878 [Aureobasidium subglaciale EXF-2481]KER00576.1 hypothetical protein AUEXF2481DRAFT_143878 [Aureobasidium subglaciale EXF-2481]
MHGRSIAKSHATEIIFSLPFHLIPLGETANFEISPFFPLMYLDSLLAGRPCRGRRHVYQHKPYCDRQSGSGIVAQSYAITLKWGAYCANPICSQLPIVCHLPRVTFYFCRNAFTRKLISFGRQLASFLPSHCGSGTTCMP